MIVKKEEIIQLFNLKKSGNRGWMLGDCGFCGKGEHMGIIFGDKLSSFRCFKCGESGTLFILLKHVKKLDLLEKNRTVDRDIYLQNKIQIENEELDLDYSLPKKTKPIGFKRVYSNEYLESRGFTKEQFKLFHVGTTKLDPEARNEYVIFLIMEGGECKGYVARSIKSKIEIDNWNLGVKNHNNIAKLQGGRKLKKYLRYVNSHDTEFMKMLFGYEEITEDVDTVILVEGIMDKFNIDRLMDLYKVDNVKCNALFGKPISSYQVKRLQDKKVENIILLYDSDAVNESKKYGAELSKYFNVEVGFMPEDKDPGDLNSEELFNIMSNLESPMNFNISKVKKVDLV